MVNQQYLSKRIHYPQIVDVLATQLAFQEPIRFRMKMEIWMSVHKFSLLKVPNHLVLPVQRILPYPVMRIAVLPIQERQQVLLLAMTLA